MVHAPYCDWFLSWSLSNARATLAVRYEKHDESIQDLLRGGTGGGGGGGGNADAGN